MITDASRRAAAVSALRLRLAAMGGLPGPAAPGGDEVPRARLRREPAAPAALPGFEPEETPAGTAWVRRHDADLGPLLDECGARAPATPAQLIRLAPHAGCPSAVTDEQIAVLDIETLGLRGSGVLPFLVGIGVPRGRRLEVEQLLLVDPGAEAALLHALLSRLRPRALLVTYNGRTFDVPVLRSRLIVNRLAVDALESFGHCDLLGPVRRLFRDRLGGCTLHRAETSLLGIERAGDVPGSEAPARYHAWLRGAPAQVMTGVVRHNQQDLLSTMVLGARLACHVEGSVVEPAHPTDHYRLALHLERTTLADADDRAEAHLRAAYAAGHGVSRDAGHRLAVRLRRRGDPAATEEAVLIWSALVRRDPADLRAARALAVILERRRRYDDALALSRGVLAHLGTIEPWRVARLRGAPAGGWENDWLRRARRLGRRLERRGSRPMRLALSL